MKSLIFIFLLPLTAHAGLGPIDNDISRSVGDSRYVNVTGDTMTGGLAVNGQASTIYGLTVSSNVSLAGVITTVGGKVGISSATPSSLLTIQDKGISNTESVLSIRQANATPAAGLMIGNDTVDALYYRGMKLKVNASGAGQIDVLTAGVANPLVLQANGQGGNVGIGTTAPGSKLEVNGSVHVVTSMTVATDILGLNNMYLTDTKALGFSGAGNSGSYAIQAKLVAPYYPLRFIGSSDGSTNRYFEYGWYSGDSLAGAWNRSAAINSYNGNIFSSGTITALGNVGIGTTAPQTKFVVSSGTITADGNVEPGINVVGTLGLALGNDSVANFATSTPTKIGTIKYCANCSTVGVCVSTGIVQGAWALITNKAAACQ